MAENRRFTIPSIERMHIEFKERLIPEIHLRTEKRQKLASQMKYRLENGGGTAVYILGVRDDGTALGISDIELEESLSVLKQVASECGAVIDRVEKFDSNGGLIARVIITTQSRPSVDHLVVSVAGHVNHGKSTFLACLITGEKDDGQKWLYLDTLPHEVERNLSADLHFIVLGFRGMEPNLMKNPLDRAERIRVTRESERLVSFVDTVGHEPWLRTTIRGILGQEIDYGFLVVAADDGPTHITREHLGIMLAMGIPVIILITKIDKVPANRVEAAESEIATLLKRVGRIPFIVNSINDVELLIDKVSVVVPVLKISSVTRQGYDLVYHLLRRLPPRAKKRDLPFLLYIDRVYNVEGVGNVVSGSVKQGSLTPGAELLIGPTRKGVYVPVRARSIEMHYTRLAEAEPGYIVGVAVKGVREELLERGMIVCEPSLNPVSVWSFEAEVTVLSHPTRISTGYEPIVHIHTIASTTRVKLLDKPYLKAGESGRVEMRFKYRPFYIQPGDRFVFREGKTKGIGVVTKILETS
ncbi:Elongation factor Tu [archaeon HR03]|uniref:Elongation factor EF-1 alpha subunit n=1 Tax=Caldiarchaeum subterraneum TaxID=311458 RepID=E6N9Q0_CALS0|nr:elongation factor EF-1 alpha subunit [Candidatus Caldarchaeum subterraneum]GBC72487.1 Elongation factor Tu [archaeon HR03]